MMKHVKKVGFLLIIDEKNTRVNILAWKRTFYGFIELFKDFSEELLNSIGWIITKSHPELNEETM